MKKKFSEISLEWLSYQKSDIKPSTYANYEFAVIRHINPFFDNYKLENIERIAIQNFIKHKLENGRLDNNLGLNPKSVEDLVMVLKQIIDYSFVAGYIKKFYSKFKVPNGMNKKEKLKVFNEIDYEKLVNFFYNNYSSVNIGILIAFNTGIRAGELSALKWSDIDLDNECIYISKTVQRIYSVEKKTKVIEESTKSKTSNRRIPINKTLLPYLKKYKCADDLYILTNTTKCLEPRSLRYGYKKVLTELKIDYLSFHSIRHTFATRLVNNNVNIKIVSELLGHSSVSITLDTYVHTNDEDKINALNDVF